MHLEFSLLKKYPQYESKYEGEQPTNPGLRGSQCYKVAKSLSGRQVSSANG